MTGGYTYDPSGKRVLQETLSNGNITQLQIYFYSITGQRIATYKSVSNGSGGFTQTTSLNLFFGGKQIRSAGVTVATDRLGSVRANANSETFQYWPLDRSGRILPTAARNSGRTSATTDIWTTRTNATNTPAGGEVLDAGQGGCRGSERLRSPKLEPIRVLWR